MAISIDEQHWELRQRYKIEQVGNDQVLPEFALEILKCLFGDGVVVDVTVVRVLQVAVTVRPPTLFLPLIRHSQRSLR